MPDRHRVDVGSRHGWWRPVVDHGKVPFSIAVVALVVTLVVPSGQIAFAEIVVIYGLFATSVNLLFGKGGIPSFGQAAFFGAGAYTVALLGPVTAQAIPDLLAACAVAGVLGLLVGMLTWRSNGLAFAMLTLAVGQVAYTLAQTTGVLGGYNGLADIPQAQIASIRFGSTDSYWFLVCVIAGLGMLGLRFLWRSPYGRMISAMRDDADRLAGLGVNVTQMRVVTFAAAAVFGGLAGGLYAFTIQAVSPDNLYWTVSAAPVVMLLLGGRNTFWGPLVGAVIYEVAVDQISGLTTSYDLYLGLILLVVVLFARDGIAGGVERGADWIRFHRVGHRSSGSVQVDVAWRSSGEAAGDEDLSRSAVERFAVVPVRELDR